MSQSTKLTASFHIGIPLHYLSVEETTPKGLVFNLCAN
jgi:hypothetical protein